MSWLILFVHLFRGPRNIRHFLLIIVYMRRSLLWVIGFCWMLLTLASLGSANLGSGLVGPVPCYSSYWQSSLSSRPQGSVHTFSPYFSCELDSQVCSRWLMGLSPLSQLRLRIPRSMLWSRLLAHRCMDARETGSS